MDDLHPGISDNMVDLTGPQYDSGTEEQQIGDTDPEQNNEDDAISTENTNDTHSSDNDDDIIAGNSDETPLLPPELCRLVTREKAFQHICDNIRAQFDMHDHFPHVRLAERRTLQHKLFGEIKRSVELEDVFKEQTVRYIDDLKNATMWVENNNDHFDNHPMVIGIPGYDMPKDIKIKLRMASFVGGEHSRSPPRDDTTYWSSCVHLYDTRHYTVRLSNVFFLGLYCCNNCLMGTLWELWSEVWPLIKTKKLPSNRFWWDYYRFLQAHDLVNNHRQHIHYGIIRDHWFGIVRSFYYQLHVLPRRFRLLYPDETAEYFVNDA